jgi:hypothetical protein
MQTQASSNLAGYRESLQKIGIEFPPALGSEGIKKGAEAKWHLLKHNPMTFVLVERRWMIGGIFCEVNRRRRSRRGIREKFPQSFDRSRTLDA